MRIVLGMKVLSFFCLLAALTACGGSDKTETVLQLTDTTPPVITLNGESSITLLLGDNYRELGASATDEREGNVAVIITGAVDINTLGSYSITYAATDSIGNNTSIIRAIIVVQPPDATPPVITLNGDSSITLILNDTYSELGANAIDDNDGNIDVVITGAVDTNTLGSYVITYTATDSANNSSNLTRTVLLRAAKPFITTWNTSGGGISYDNQVMIDTEGDGYHYSVAWGDGTVDENVTGDITHTYSTSGTYQVSISGSFPRIYFESIEIENEGNLYYMSDNGKLASVEQWGDIQWHSMQYAFRSASFLVENAADSPDLSRVTDMSGMFWGASNFNQDIGNWDVSNVTSMDNIFRGASTFNQDIGNWDVSNVSSMSNMFLYASTFNQYLGNWDVSNVTDMSNMFSYASMFDQDIGNWDVSNVTSIYSMFYYASAFNQDIGNWDVSNIISMYGMFYHASAFNQDIGNWDVSNVTNMRFMFDQASTFNQDIGNWDVSNVTDMEAMFSNASIFNQEIGNWDVSNVTIIKSMFYGASAFNQNIGNWAVSNVTDMRAIFSNASTFNQDIGNWDVSNVTIMSAIFDGASAFNQEIGNWDTSNATDMSYMFSNASAFNQDIGNWDVSNVTTMEAMFKSASAFNQDMSNWNTSNVRNMSYMFRYAPTFNQDIGNWNVSIVNYMRLMFDGVTLSTINYDALLIGWANQHVQENVEFNGGNSQYSSAAQSARATLVDVYGWDIYDDDIAN